MTTATPTTTTPPTRCCECGLLVVVRLLGRATWWSGRRLPDLAYAQVLVAGAIGPKVFAQSFEFLVVDALTKLVSVGVHENAVVGVDGAEHAL